MILLTPLAAVGALLHFPAYQLCKFLAHRFTHHGADDVASTVKVLAAMVFMPLTWIAAAGVVFYFAGWQAALASLPVSLLLGWIALSTLERGPEQGAWARAVVLYLAEKESFLRLFVERQKLTDELRGLNVGGAK